MPGRRLNDNERHLQEIWDNPRAFPKSILKGIDIFADQGTEGIRGIKGLIISFNYPVSVICGKNGVGKTTILSLAALAHHSPENWYCYRGLFYHPIHRDNDRDYYIFPDFFFKGHEDPRINGVRICWRYFSTVRNDFELEIHKTSSRWMKYDRRPEREVDYIPVSRVIPSIDIGSLRKIFKTAVTGGDVDVLNEEYINHLSYIVGKQYTIANIQHARKYTLKRCRTNCQYTGFNMGAGESCVIELLALIQRMPNGGLVVIEEVELGLHPEAQARLAEKLIEIALNKKIQVICSSHSEAFVDALPRIARILLKRQGEDHEIYEATSTRFAMHELRGIPHPELQIFCEDEFSANLIKECISTTNKIRVSIISVGCGASLARQAVSHERSGAIIKALTIFDGDCSDQDIQNWINSERSGNNAINPEYIKLPGDNLSPEAWVLRELRYPDYSNRLSTLLGCTTEQANEHIEAMSVEQDPHNIFYRLQQRTGNDFNVCIQRVSEAIVPRHPQFDNIRELINQLLEEQ